HPPRALLLVHGRGYSRSPRVVPRWRSRIGGTKEGDRTSIDIVGLLHGAAAAHREKEQHERGRNWGSAHDGRRLESHNRTPGASSFPPWFETGKSFSGYFHSTF